MQSGQAREGCKAFHIVVPRPYSCCASPFIGLTPKQDGQVCNHVTLTFTAKRAGDNQLLLLSEWPHGALVVAEVEKIGGDTKGNKPVFGIAVLKSDFKVGYLQL